MTARHEHVMCMNGKPCAGFRRFIENLKKNTIMGLFKDKTRWQHFKYAIPIGLVFTILCVLGVASGMEFKDEKYGNKWDWGDWTCTMMCGMVGQALQVAIILLIIYLL